MPTASEAATAPRECGVCGRRYQRSSHLRRHEATHIRSKQYRCDFCAKAFSRRDVCRKHAISCPQRTSPDLPPPTRRGQRPRACDSCFKSKVLCNNAVPCSRCTVRGTACTYSRAIEDPGAASTSLGAPERTTPPSGRFLLGLSDPKADTMVDTIVHEFSGLSATAEGSDQSPSTGPSRPPEDFLMDYNFFYWGLNQYQPGEFSETLADAFMDYGIQFDPSCSVSSSTDEHLTGSISAILEELDAFYSSLEANNQLPSGDYYFDMATAHEVLTPANMRTHMAAFRRYTNTFYPIVHIPTFDVDDAPPILTLSLFLCGTLYCGDKERNYRGFYNIAEEYAFIQLRTALGKNAVDGATGTKEVTAALRTATLIHTLQWLISCASSRRRNRDLRLPTLISAIRTLGYTRLRHAERNPGSELNWEKFIELETSIRTTFLVVQSDWQLSGTYHSPCLTTLYELTGDLPCHRSLWEAKDAAEFQAIIRAKGVGILHRPYSIRCCIEDLMSDDCSTTELAPLRKLTIADVDLLLGAIHSLIASARLNCTLPALAPKVARAVSRWEDLWKVAMSKVDEEELESSVSLKHSKEFCWLATRFIEMSAGGKEDAAYFKGVAHESLEELHALVKGLQDK